MQNDKPDPALNPNGAKPPISVPPLTKKERKQAKRKQEGLVKEINDAKYRAVNKRRLALSNTTILYLLALSKVEANILSCTPLIIRQAHFILFAHQIVMYGKSIKRLCGSKSKERDTLWTKTSNWMSQTAHRICKALNLSISDDSFTAGVIKHLPELVNAALALNSALYLDADSSSKSKSKSKIPVSPTAYTETADQNVILNPMYAKAIILKYSRSFQNGVINAISDDCADLRELRPGTCDKGTTMQMASQESGLSSSISSSLRRFGSFGFNGRTPTNAVPPPSAVPVRCGWLMNMKPERLLELQSHIEELPPAAAPVIQDIAVRIRHLPSITPDIIANASPINSSDMLLHRDVSPSGNELTELSEEDQCANSESVSGEDELDDSPDLESNPLAIQDVADIAAIESPRQCARSTHAALTSMSADVFMGEDSPQISTTPSPVSLPAPQIETEDQTNSWIQVAEIINLPTVLIWGTMSKLMLDKYWDSGVEHVFRCTSESLDMNDDYVTMLIALAADAICGPPLSNDALEAVDTGALKRLVKKPDKQNIMRGLKIAGMSVGVGALSAVTAGLAAPAFAAGFGALGLAGTSGLTAFLGSAGGAASLASVFGASSASLSGWKYSRRLADIRFCGFVKLDANSNRAGDAIEGYMYEISEHRDHRNRIGVVARDSKQLKTMSSYIKAGKSTMPRPLGLHHLRADQTSDLSRVEPPFGLVIGVSGWLKGEANKVDEKAAAKAGWDFLRDRLGTENYAFQWEPQLLHDLGFMMVRLLGENVAYQAAALSLQIALSASAGFIMWPVSFIQYAGQLDNAWMTAKERAQQAGVILAAAICDKATIGNRPVTLIGCSMGSRVITYCLKELYQQGEFLRVTNAVLVGLPDGKNKDDWRKMRSVVSGRLINVYNSNDYILMFLYRWMEWGVSVAGLSAVEGVPGVENEDVSLLIQSHYEYEEKLPEILSLLKFHTSLVKIVDQEKDGS